MTWSYYGFSNARTGIRLVSRAPIARLSERTARPPEYTNAAETNEEDFSASGDDTDWR